jgi:hypothetical protein
MAKIDLSRFLGRTFKRSEASAQTDTEIARDLIAALKDLTPGQTVIVQVEKPDAANGKYFNLTMFSNTLPYARAGDGKGFYVTIVPEKFE